MEASIRNKYAFRASVLGNELYRKKFKTITVGNDSEFLDYGSMEKSSLSRTKNVQKYTMLILIDHEKEEPMNRQMR